MQTTVVSQTSSAFVPVLPILLCAPKYVAGEMTLGEVMQASSAFVIVQVAFNWLVDNYPRLADWAASARRAFVFGSGLAIVPFLHGGVVNEFGWLNERQFLGAVAVAMITPGPVVITVAFIGYLVAGPLGATMAAIGVFLPCYLLVVIPATYFRRSIGSPHVKAFVDGVTAAATGAIAGAAFVLGRRAIVDVPTVLIAAGTLILLVKARKIPEPLVIVAAGVLGFVIWTATGSASCCP